MYTCFRCARNSYYANRFCRVLPRSKCYSSKTCLMCILCTLEYVRCSNGTMKNTSTLILWYRLLTDLRALINEPLSHQLATRGSLVWFPLEIYILIFRLFPFPHSSSKSIQIKSSMHRKRYDIEKDGGGLYDYMYKSALTCVK